MSHTPLVTVAPFTIYDRCAKTKSDTNATKIKHDVIGIILVEVILIRLGYRN